MLSNERLKRAAEHVGHAQALLQCIEEKQPAFASSIREHLVEAITRIDEAREEGRQVAPPVKRRTVSEITSGILGTLSLLLHQMGQTSRRLEPLRPTRKPKNPVRRLGGSDLAPIAESLGSLRRLTSRMEAEVRLLDQCLEEDSGETRRADGQ